ncbi:MAG: ATP-binding protein [Coriobacteriales bacterium]|jgi:signal transduction histidine kinase|nr:ATP-binding protein [Coriobacteriales bacterium]
MSEDDLKSFIEQVSGGAHLRVEDDLGNGFVRLRVEEAERRQAKHDIRCIEDVVVELLRNARDAGAKSIYLATTRDGDVRLITVVDDGSGIPANLQKLVFEPRVTSKLESMVVDEWGVHGRGMALYSIKSNVTNARVIASGEGLGTALSVEADVTALPEKADQSSFPILDRDDQGRIHVARGPHNILRLAVEFALLHRRDPDIYLGSPSEIAATLLDQGHRQVSTDTLFFCDNVAELPVSQRLALSADAAELMTNAAGIGLPISERTAHRILVKQIQPLKSLYEQVKSRNVRHAPADLSRDNRSLKLAKEDIEAFSREMESAFDLLADRYYLSLSDTPKVSVKGDVITVRFPIEKD